MKVLASIFIFMVIFAVREEDVVVPSASTMYERGECIFDCYLVGVLSAKARNILRPQDALGLLQDI